MKELIMVMGISGSGKSTIGQALAIEMGLPFIDADDFHPQENIKKMSRGEALNDDDRWPWLASIVEYVLDSHRPSMVLACSALKTSYREYLGQRLTLKTLFLNLSRDEAIRRLADRKGHFMPTSLVDSQLNTLEEPKEAVSVSATDSISSIVQTASQHFSTHNLNP